MSMFKYELGGRVKDIVTGFKGVVTARSEFLNGCIRYAVQSSKLDKDGKPTESEHFDEAQLEPDAGKQIIPNRQPIHQQADQPVGPPGGPRDPVRQRADVPR